jgi:crotonobetainyl-CoA:carnitine CoA-transferase CaiB-like acyl-CoA transferase
VLSPYRVLDLTDDHGHLAAFLLAQLGAEVVLVEPAGGSAARRVGPFLQAPGQNEQSLWHLAYNRGKKSVTLDGIDVDALCQSADVVIESGAVPLDIDRLVAQNPLLVAVSISPFGRTGPKAGWLASDLTLAAASGQLALTGDHDRAPVRISEPQVFHHAAADAAVAAVIALLERARSGRGQHVDVSAQQSFMLATQGSMLAAAVRAPEAERMAGGLRVGPYLLRLVYPASDGHVTITYLFGDMIGPYTQRLMSWVHEEGFCSAELRDLDYVSFFELLFTGQLDVSLLTQAADAVAALTATKTKAELFAQARRRRLLIAPVETTKELASFEQFASRGFWDEVPVETGEAGAGPRAARFPGPWAHPTRTPLRHLGPAPSLGEHNRLAPDLLHRRPSAPSAIEPPPTARALDGLKVLDFTWVVAGPLTTRLLADHGATVVRIESEKRLDPVRAGGPFLAGLSGVEDSAGWHNYAAGKHSLQLDVSHPAATPVVVDLVRWADLVIESFTPGVIPALGFGYDVLRDINPAVVMCSTSLMGQTGPLAKFSGFGNLAAALTGFYEITGWPDRPPAGPFLAYTDYVAPRFAALSALAAVDHARRTGEGQYVDIAQGEAALHLLAPALLQWTINDRVVTRRGNDDPTCVPHGVYPGAGTDRWVAIACQDDAQWRRLAALIGRDDLAHLTAADRRARRDELDDVIATWTRQHPPDIAQARLQQAGVAAHDVQNSTQCVTDPQLAHRRHFRRVPHPRHGETFVEGPNGAYSRTAPYPAWAGPTVGQHNEAVLRDILGYDDDTIAELVIAGAIT